MIKQSDDDNDNEIITIAICNRKFSKVQNFGVKLKYLPEEILLTSYLESMLECHKSLYLYMSNI